MIRFSHEANSWQVYNSFDDAWENIHWSTARALAIDEDYSIQI
jgi:hypothetical protein